MTQLIVQSPWLIVLDEVALLNHSKGCPITFETLALLKRPVNYVTLIWGWHKKSDVDMSEVTAALVYSFIVLR